MLKKMIALMAAIMMASTVAASAPGKDPRAKPPIHLDDLDSVTPQGIMAARTPEIGYYDMTPDITTNLASTGTGRLHYLRIHVNVMVKDKSDLDFVSKNDPVIRDAILTIIGTKDYGSISTVSGRESLRAECRTRVSDILSEKRGGAVVQDLLFTNYVYQ